MDALGLRENTVIVFSADHGWSLGEHGMWCKENSFSMVNRVPLYISTPDMTEDERGTLSETPVELVDLMPTIIKAAGLGELDLCPEESGGKYMQIETMSFMLSMKSKLKIQKGSVGISYMI